MPKINELVESGLAKAEFERTIKYWSTKKLMDEMRSLHEAIHITDCYGSSDIAKHGMIHRELHRRGWVTEPKYFVDLTFYRLDKSGNKVYS